MLTSRFGLSKIDHFCSDSSYVGASDFRLLISRILHLISSLIQVDISTLCQIVLFLGALKLRVKV